MTFGMHLVLLKSTILMVWSSTLFIELIFLMYFFIFTVFHRLIFRMLLIIKKIVKVFLTEV